MNDSPLAARYGKVPETPNLSDSFHAEAENNVSISVEKTDPDERIDRRGELQLGVLIET